MMNNNLKHTPESQTTPVLVSSYALDEALMMQEALDFTLRECSHLHMKNRMDHGSLLTVEEEAALEKLSIFLVKESLRFTSFILEHSKGGAK